MKAVLVPLSVTNLYLLPCQGGYLQVDTGYDRDYPAYRRGLERVGIRLEEIKYLLLTHHHDDHAGFLNELVHDAELTIIAHERAKALLLTGQNDRTRGGGYVSRRAKFVADIKMRLDPHWTLAFPPFALREDDWPLAGDDRQRMCDIGVAGQLLYTPGHCIDHLALAMDNGDVYCGDAAASYPPLVGIRYCAIFMTDMEESYRSWQKLLEAGAKVIYPAHGRPFPAGKLRQHMGKIRAKDLVRFFQS